MADDPRLIDALMRADAAGDSEGARIIADHIRQQRGAASGPGAPDAQSATSAAISRSPVAGPAWALAHRAADTATLGLNNVVGGALGGAYSKLAGNTDASLSDAMAQGIRQARANSSYEAAQHPVADVAGLAAGTVAGGMGIGAGLRAAEAAPGVAGAAARGFNAMTTPTAASGLAGTLGRTALGGAAAGVATGAGEGALRTVGTDSSALGGAAEGALEGGIGGGVVGGALGTLGRGAGKLGASVMGRLGLGQENASAWGILARKLGIDPAVMAAGRDSAEANLGFKPAIADMMNIHQAGQLNALAEAHPEIGSTLAAARQAREAVLPARMQNRLEEINGPAPTQATLEANRGADFKQGFQNDDGRSVTGFDVLGDKPVTLAPSDVTLLSSKPVQRIVRDNPGLNSRVNAAIEALTPKTNADGTPGAGAVRDRSLSVNDLHMIRADLAQGAQQAGQVEGSAMRDAATGLRNIVEGTHPDYGALVDRFAAQSRGLEGFQAGQAGAPNTFTSGLPERTGSAAEGYAQGQAARLAKAAGDNPAALAADLSSNPNVTARMASAMRPEDVAALQQAGQQFRQVGDSWRTIAPRANGTPDAAGNSLAYAARNAATGHVAGAAAHLMQALSGLRMSPGTQRVVARQLADPASFEQGIANLRRAGATQDAINRLSQGLGVYGGTFAGAEAAR
jgi:hypothetical protein